MGKNSTPKVWQETFKIRSYEVDPTGHVTFQSICNYLQEVAGNHASALNVSADKLIKLNLTWVLSRLHVKMQKYPFWQQQITIDTWPSKVDKLYAIRDFRLFDTKEHSIGTATSSWMLIDIKKRRPVHMPEFISKLHQECPERAIEDSFDKLPEPGSEQHLKFFNVRFSDLDMNQHVNHVNYIEWGLESVPKDISKSHMLTGIEISFKAESNYGNRIKSVSEIDNDKNDPLFKHRLTRESDNKELARMKSSWRTIKQ